MPLVVAINKVDKPGADIERVKQVRKEGRGNGQGTYPYLSQSPQNRMEEKNMREQGLILAIIIHT